MNIKESVQKRVLLTLLKLYICSEMPALFLLYFDILKVTSALEVTKKNCKDVHWCKIVSFTRTSNKINSLFVIYLHFCNYNYAFKINLVT